MKLLSPTEIKAAKESELSKDLLRTEAIKTALSSVTSNLDISEAKFEVALTNQRLRWSKEEQEYTSRIRLLEIEVKSLEAARVKALIPIEEEARKAHDLFVEANAKLNTAIAVKKQADDGLVRADDLTELLQSRIDSLSSKESDIELREQKIVIKEEAIDKERAQITEYGRVKMADIIRKEDNADALYYSLLTKEKNIAAREDAVRKALAGFANRELSIQDRYQALLKSEREITDKQNGNRKRIT